MSQLKSSLGRVQTTPLLESGAGDGRVVFVSSHFNRGGHEYGCAGNRQVMARQAGRAAQTNDCSTLGDNRSAGSRGNPQPG